MRRKDREMNKTFALDVLKKSPYVVLSLTDENNNPYCIPISIVLEENHLYFHCATEGKKIDLLKNNNQVCICAVSRCKPRPEDFTMEFESAVLYGKAEEVKEKEEKIHALKLICLRYAKSNMDMFDDAINRSLERTNVIKINIDEITGKRKKYSKEGKELKYGEN